MELRIKRTFQLCLCLMLMLLSLPTAIIKADTGNALSEFSDIVEIYGNNDILYVKNAKVGSTITIDGTDYTIDGNGEFSESFTTLGITGIEDTTVTVVTPNDKTLNYTLKEIPFETDGRTIKSELTTISDSEYYTFYSTNNDGIGNPHRLNRTLVVKSGGVLYVGGGSSSGFSVGYGGEGTLTIEDGGTVSIHTYHYYNGAQLLSSIADSKGYIEVDGGLYQVDVSHGVGFGMVGGTNKNTEGHLIIKNNGKALVKAHDVFIGYSADADSTTAKGIVEIESGSLDLIYNGSIVLGFVQNGTGNALGEIRLAKGQSMTINNNTFDSYEDDLSVLPNLYRSDDSSFIYYNWDGTNGYYTNTNEVIEFDYGASKDKTGTYDANDFEGLDTIQIGTGIYQGLLSTAANATAIESNGYQLNNHMYERLQVTVVPATIQTIIPVDGISVDYGETPTTLPATVSVTLNNGSSINVPVNWKMNLYNAKQVGKQEITGTLVYPDYVDGSTHSTVNMTITVKEQTKLPDTGVDNNAMTVYGMMLLLAGSMLVGMTIIDKKRKQALK